MLTIYRIQDPFLDLNELSARWVAEKAWVYRTQFRKPTKGDTSESAMTDIVFEGLDTFATVLLNGTEILKSENMFVSHRVNISGLLKDENVLEITFDSAMLRGRELAVRGGCRPRGGIRNITVGRGTYRICIIHLHSLFDTQSPPPPRVFSRESDFNK